MNLWVLGFLFPLSVGMSGSLQTQLVFKGHAGGGLLQGQVVDKEAALQSAPDSAEAADARPSGSSWVVAGKWVQCWSIHFL